MVASLFLLYTKKNNDNNNQPYLKFKRATDYSVNMSAYTKHANNISYFVRHSLDIIIRYCVNILFVINQMLLIFRVTLPATLTSIKFAVHVLIYNTTEQCGKPILIRRSTLMNWQLNRSWYIAYTTGTQQIYCGDTPVNVRLPRC